NKNEEATLQDWHQHRLGGESDYALTDATENERGASDGGSETLAHDPLHSLSPKQGHCAKEGLGLGDGRNTALEMANEAPGALAAGRVVGGRRGLQKRSLPSESAFSSTSSRRRHKKRIVWADSAKRATKCRPILMGLV
ncbi:hypothetical protein H0H92_004078, partial [Tricholoma furcatifolium]